jgi:hypothetical protein
MEYETVFDVSQQGVRWFPSVLGVGFILFGLVLLKNKGSSKGTNLKAYFAILVGILSCIGIPAFQYSNVFYYRQILLQNKAQIVKGVIVDGVLFAYSDYFLTPAFNNTSSHGGPLKEGLQVRIYYTDSREFSGYKAILRIDVKQ